MAVFSITHSRFPLTLPFPTSASVWKTLTRSPLSECSPGGSYRLQIRASSDSGRAHGPLLDANSMTLLKRRIEELRERGWMEPQAIASKEQEKISGVVYNDDDGPCDVDDHARNDLRSSRVYKERHGSKSNSYTSCSILYDKHRPAMMRPSGEELYWYENNLTWMDWEVEYMVFYQEEVMCMMARLQWCLLECRPSRSLLLLLSVCLCMLVGAFHILSSPIAWLLPRLHFVVRAYSRY